MPAAAAHHLAALWLVVGFIVGTYVARRRREPEREGAPDAATEDTVTTPERGGASTSPRSAVPRHLFTSFTLSNDAADIAILLRSLARAGAVDDGHRSELEAIAAAVESNKQLHAPKLSPQSSSGETAAISLDGDTKRWLYTDYRLTPDGSEQDGESRARSPFRHDAPRKGAVRREATPPPAMLARRVAGRHGSGSFPEGMHRSGSEVGPLSDAVVGVLERKDEWTFDVFEFCEAESTGSHLVVLAQQIIVGHNLLSALEIPERKLIRFLRKVQEGYNAVPYHDSVHACDVLQTFNHLAVRKGMTEWMTDVELLAMIIACAVHDFQHPGVNNNFLVAQGNELAIRYNDKSVLENHHAAATFALLQNPDMNFLCNMSKENVATFRRIVVSVVLCTDMASHFSIVSSFKSQAANGFDLNEESDRITIFCMTLKVADISNAAKPIPLATRWAERVLEEFFSQGDRERALGHPISPLCDRNLVDKPKSQVDFIDFIVLPMFSTFAVFMTELEDEILPCLKKTRAHWQGLVRQAAAA